MRPVSREKSAQASLTLDEVGILAYAAGAPWWKGHAHIVRSPAGRDPLIQPVYRQDIKEAH